VAVRFRLVATDLDGTLLRADSTVSERTRAALRAIEEAGCRVVLVTGRPPRIARLFAEAAGVSGPLVCCNGALVCDASGREVIRHSPIDGAAAAQLVASIREAVPGVCFAAEIATEYAREHAYAALAGAAAAAEPIDSGAPSLYEDAVGFCGSPITKLLARHAEVSPEHLLEVVEAVLGDSAVATVSGGPFVEISAAGVHKAHALEALCVDLGIDASEVIAFGDMPNDLPMLRWAGRAVAVANAHPAVLAEVDEVTGSNEDDGVAQYLEGRRWGSDPLAGGEALNLG
jgi:Cof subfamily protein (haloacid dehalogenase superfamily)